MPVPLHVLILEDRLSDAELMLYELGRAGFDPLWQRVETEADFLARLDPAPDVILADYSMPQFTALRALQLLRERGLNIPFIVVTGSIGDEAVAECARQGAADYLLKDRLARLGQAVTHALQQKRLHDEKQRAEAALRESEERYRQLVELSPDVIAIHSRGLLVFINPAGARLLGATSPEQLIGRPILEFVHPDDRETFIAQSQRAGERGAEPPLMEGRFIRLDGRTVEAEVASIFFTWQDEAAAQIVARDISERKRAEEERARLLARERAVREEAEEANRAKDEFLMTLSHELRTPLTSILGWARLLGSGEVDQATINRAVEVIARNAKSQANLIEELLDVSRIITGNLSLNIRAVELGSVTQAAVDAMRPAADARGIHLEMVPAAGECPVTGDPERLQQVVVNLLSNAIKFTPKGGRAEVRLESAAPHARITVSDTGQGIKPEFLPHVFERFRQADASSTRQHGGLGLGLTIVRQMVELHGGTVRAESPGKGLGATFTVELPLVQPRAAGRRQTESPDPPESPDEKSANRRAPAPYLAGLRVMLVDDDRDICEMLTIALTQCGAEVKAFSSAAETLEALGRWQPDVLVADIGMPDEDGYSLIRKVRALAPERGGRVPAMALTAYAGAEDRRHVLEAGFQMHVAKPVLPIELAGIIARLTAQSGHTRA
ncbi:MAG TPA: ATP-binding protein [Blastocatellia bacterium]|nr:ATP-binding protein [Blastocatellia bacterium]